MNSHLSISVMIEILLTSALVVCQFSVSELKLKKNIDVGMSNEGVRMSTLYVRYVQRV